MGASYFKRIKNRSLFVGLVVATLVSLGLATAVYAYSDPCNRYFCSYDVSGYFTNHNPAHAGSMASVIDPGSSDAIPSSVNTVVELVSFLQGKNSSSDKHNKTGSAFIVCLMLQQTTFSGCKTAGFIVNNRTITASGWSELSDRLNNPSLSINFKKYVNKKANFTNSAYDTVAGDTYIYTRGKNESGYAIVIKNGADTIFSMFRHCANPLDGLPGLPPPPIIKYAYTLTPHLTLTSDLVESGNGVYTQNLYVNNNGDGTVSPPITWKIKRNINSGAFSDVYAGPTNPTIPLGDTGLPQYSTNDTDYDAGTKLCYKLSVLPHSNSDSGWVDSAENSCVVVGKRPKTRILGSDLLVRGGTDTSISSKTVGGSSRTFGSWVEYAIFATGSITKTASGSAFADTGMPTDNSVSAACRYSTLSFVNVPTTPEGSTVCTGTGGTIGGYSNISAVPNIGSSFTADNANLSGTVMPQNLGSGVYPAASLTMGNPAIPSVLPGARSVIIKAAGTVKIVGDLLYSNGPYTRISDVPQLVIIAGNIDIADNVKRIDAWLVAKDGYINTCSSYNGATLAVNAGLSVNMCQNKLVVNGPVMANNLYLRRTAGSESGTKSGDPAEEFNLRAYVYLWAYSRASGIGHIQTVYTTELPPRL